MPDRPTVEELHAVGLVRNPDVDAAIDAYLADRSRPPYPIVAGYVVDIAAAVAAHPFSRAVLAGTNPSKARARSAVRSAILRARPRQVDAVELGASK